MQGLESEFAGSVVLLLYESCSSGLSGIFYLDNYRLNQEFTIL